MVFFITSTHKPPGEKEKTKDRKAKSSELVLGLCFRSEDYGVINHMVFGFWWVGNGFKTALLVPCKASNFFKRWYYLRSRFQIDSGPF